jgi:uncharacterized protein with NAD-binding domain and iron-sulfur cluster
MSTLLTKIAISIVTIAIPTIPLCNSWTVISHPRLKLLSLHSQASNDVHFVPSIPDGDVSPKASPTRIVIVGAGWAGFSAAETLLSSSVESKRPEVIVLDSSPRGPGGLAGGWRTPSRRSIEAGLHGFWRDYRNTYAMIERIGISLNQILTPYTPSLLFSESGRVARAPVLGESTKGTSQSSNYQRELNPLLQEIASALPHPLDLALLSDFEDSSPLSLLDRLSAIGLLGIWADFEPENADSWKRYDGMSAEQLFLSVAGVTPTLYRELVTPLLHVLPMTPGYDCSAAAALSCFHVFALQSKGAFDVRWCRANLAETIFDPWAERLLENNVEIRRNSKVTSISQLDDSGPYHISINNETTIECDAIVLAVGGTAMSKLVTQSPPLKSLSIAWNKIRGVTCVAVRLFVKPAPTITIFEDGTSTQLPVDMAQSMSDSPVLVCGPRILARELAETGFCLYDLQRLQTEFITSSANSVAALEVDFFRADSIAAMSNEDVVDLTLRAVAAVLGVTPLGKEDILESSVIRADRAVSHFDVNSASRSPKIRPGRKGIYFCGDWIDRTGHSSWSTEKAVVTGQQAAQALSIDFNIMLDQFQIIPASQDSKLLSSLRQLAKNFRSLPTANDIIPVPPWMMFSQDNKFSGK